MYESSLLLKAVSRCAGLPGGQGRSDIATHRGVIYGTWHAVMAHMSIDVWLSVDRFRANMSTACCWVAP
jgi:hypothetical protein